MIIANLINSFQDNAAELDILSCRSHVVQPTSCHHLTPPATFPCTQPCQPAKPRQAKNSPACRHQPPPSSIKHNRVHRVPPNPSAEPEADDPQTSRDTLSPPRRDTNFETNHSGESHIEPSRPPPIQPQTAALPSASAPIHTSPRRETENRDNEFCPCQPPPLPPGPGQQGRGCTAQVGRD